jgi:fumarate reductase subunit C
MVYAVRGGLGAAEIVGRVQGNGAWLAFYAVFVAAAAVHAPIGLRTVLTEWTPLTGRAAAGVAVAVAVALAWMGWRAVFMLYGGA